MEEEIFGNVLINLRSRDGNTPGFSFLPDENIGDNLIDHSGAQKEGLELKLNLAQIVLDQGLSALISKTLHKAKIIGVLVHQLETLEACPGLELTQVNFFFANRYDWFLRIDEAFFDQAKSCNAYHNHCDKNCAKYDGASL